MWLQLIIILSGICVTTCHPFHTLWTYLCKQQTGSLTALSCPVRASMYCLSFSVAARHSWKKLTGERNFHYKSYKQNGVNCLPLSRFFQVFRTLSNSSHTQNSVTDSSVEGCQYKARQSVTPHTHLTLMVMCQAGTGVQPIPQSSLHTDDFIHLAMVWLMPLDRSIVGDWISCFKGLFVRRIVMSP